MQERVPASPRYDTLSVIFHWLSFLLVALAYLAIEVRGPRGSASRTLWMNVHIWAGSLLLVTSILRILWRLYRGAPPPVPSGPLLDWLSRIVHVALYAVVVVQPLLGILIFNLHDKPVVLAGLDWSFRLVGPSPGLAETCEEIHEVLGNVFYGVIGLHAAAALWHHYIRRDGLLYRMSLR